MEQLLRLLEELFEKEEIIQLVLGAPRKKGAACRKASMRPIVLRGSLYYQVEFHYEKKVTHENLTGKEVRALCLELLKQDFKQLNIFSANGDYQVLASKADRPKIITKKPSKTMAPLSHNQEKQYIIPDGRPCDFLIRLGVMTKDGQVIPKHYNKFRQINRFLEIVQDVFDYLPGEGKGANEYAAQETSPSAPLKIIDFGCGKAYLTFALYHYLKLMRKKNVEIVGLDLKEDVIQFCGQVARDLDYDGLRFQMGDIAQYDDTAEADMVVTLHACDTATDFALIKAVRWNCSVILSVPCCQHELFSQIQNTINAPILKQGILKERFAAILTDGLRALKLEEHGYDVSMIEFTSLEHTAKNIMLRCVKKQGVGYGSQSQNNQSPAGQSNSGPGQENRIQNNQTHSGRAPKTQAMKKARREYDELKEFWCVTPSIDGMD